MAIPKIKATYSLDPETIRLLERVSERWGVSKSEAIRRAIRESAAAPEASEERVATLDRLQEAAGLRESVADSWARAARAERRAASARTRR